jgi:hypothetical protein
MIRMIAPVSLPEQLLTNPRRATAGVKFACALFGQAKKITRPGLHFEIRNGAER